MRTTICLLVALTRNFLPFLNSYYHAPYYAANSIFPTGVNSSCFIWLKLDSLIISNNDITKAAAKRAFQRIKFNYRENSTERLKLTSVDSLRVTCQLEIPKHILLAILQIPRWNMCLTLLTTGGLQMAHFLLKIRRVGNYRLTGDVVASREPSEYWCSYETS